MDLNKNYYQCLGVDKNCTEEDIKKAFRKLSKTHHPDKGGDSSTFQEINEANSVLSDKTKKETYDVQSPHGKNPRRSNFSFEDLFSGGNGFSSFSGFQNIMEDLDLNINIQVSLKEIYNNTEKTIKYKRYVPCSTCDATGFDEESSSTTCSNCGGNGVVRDIFGRQFRCNHCNGTGSTKKACKRCNGDKLVLTDETMVIDFAYIAYGDTPKKISKRGFGNFSKQMRGNVGNFNVTLIPITNSDYRQDGFNLYHTIKLSIRDAILGTKYRYTHLDDKKIDIKITPNTNNGDKFKIPSLGLLHNKSGTRGDLIIIVELFINYETLGDSELKMIETINF